jgi:outer membrane protein OmpA-like peptidoglycan-associated protein
MSKNTKLGLLSLGAIAVVLASGCASPGKRTGIGAGAGAATGAVIGGATGGWKGAAIGGAIGGVVGGAAGNLLDRQQQELEKVAETKRTQDGLLVKLKNDLIFDTGSSTLKPNATTQLTQLGDILAKYKQDKIDIQGFTDDVGSAQTNEDLSLRRAEAVKGILVSRGVQDNQLHVSGFGENRPIASNTSAKGRAANRRVELHINVPEKHTS